MLNNVLNITARTCSVVIGQNRSAVPYGVGEGTEQLEPSQAAKIFEGQLASALVAEDGQLALSNLAQSAAHAVMPKLQTQGQLGQARYCPPAADHTSIYHQHDCMTTTMMMPISLCPTSGMCLANSVSMQGGWVDEGLSLQSMNDAGGG